MHKHTRVVLDWVRSRELNNLTLRYTIYKVLFKFLSTPDTTFSPSLHTVIDSH